MRLPVQCLTPVRAYQPPGRFGPDDPGETHRRWHRYTPRLIVHVKSWADSGDHLRGRHRVPAGGEAVGVLPAERPRGRAQGMGTVRRTIYARYLSDETYRRKIYRCGGGRARLTTSGGGSGQTSRIGQGAWSTTNRLAGPRLRGPRRVRSPSRARMSRSAPSTTATTSRSIRPTSS